MPERLAKRVLLIGWDAADWQIISPMIEQGLMPTLASFLDNGVMGNIATMEPVLSPMLWTSIATGKRPAVHGIHGFIEPRHDGSGVHPVSALSRKCKALWNILSQNGLKTNLINWYATHPAEPINGICVSDAFVRSGDRGGDGKRGPVPSASVYPLEMQASLEELRVLPEAITGHHIAPFIPTLGEIPYEKTGPLSGVQRMLARCGTIQAIATDLIEHEPWDLTAVYFEAIDHFGHAFMHYHPPRLPGIAEEDFERYKGCITGIYRFHDMMLERLLKLAGEDTTVILVSDHGFLNNHLRPVGPNGEVAGPELWHRKFGIFAMRGPGIRKDERIHGVHLLDIAPTVLTLLGVPVGRDMDGKVLAQCFERMHALQAVDSWEAIPGPDSPVGSPGTELEFAL